MCIARGGITIMILNANVVRMPFVQFKHYLDVDAVHIFFLTDTTAEIGRAATGETKCSTAGRILELTRHAGISLGYLSNVCPLPMYA